MQDRVLKVALVQMEVGSDKSMNLANAVAEIRSAKEKGAQLVVLPVYFSSDVLSFEMAEEIPSGESSQTISKAAAEYGVCVVAGTILEKDEANLYNTCTAWDHNGKRLATHRKVHLFDVDIPDKCTHKESDLISAGKNITTFEYLGVKIGLGICYDICFPEMAHCMAKRGCHLLIFPAYFEITLGETYWELLGRGRANDEQLWVALVSPARAPNPWNGYMAWGHTSIINPYGIVVDKLDEKPGTLITDIDTSLVDESRNRIPRLRQRRTDIYDIVDKSDMYL